MSEPQSITGILLGLFIVAPVFVIALFVEVTLVATAIYRFIQWVERKWWS